MGKSTMKIFKTRIPDEIAEYDHNGMLSKRSVNARINQVVWIGSAVSICVSDGRQCPPQSGYGRRSLKHGELMAKMAEEQANSIPTGGMWRARSSTGRVDGGGA